VLFSDSLTDANAGQLAKATVKEPDKVNLGYRQSEYQIQTLVPLGNWTAFVPGRYANASVAVDARIAGDVDKRYVLVNCRRQEAPFAYELHVYPGNASFALDRFDEAGTKILANDTSPSIKGGNSVNHIELGCAGNAITAKVNGTLLASVIDDKYADGRLSIGAGGISVTVDGRFTNLVATQL
jgi:hypothetical protein